MTKHFLLALIATSALSAAPLAAQEKSDAKQPPARSFAETVKAEAEAGWAKAPVEETETRTRDSVTINGKRYNYIASAGTLTTRDNEGKPTASMFYTAYTLDGTKPGTTRPITFLFNGGPGSPSFWLRMGSFAPIRIRTTSADS